MKRRYNLPNTDKELNEMIEGILAGKVSLEDIRKRTKPLRITLDLGGGITVPSIEGREPDIVIENQEHTIKMYL